MLIPLLLALCALVPQSEGDRKKLPLTAPAGWESTRQQEASVLVPKDLAAGTVYTVVVPDLTRKLGSLEALMEAAKATFAETGTFKPVGSPGTSKNEGGWDYRVVIGTIEKNGRSILGQAVALRKGEEEGLILVVSDSVETMQKYSDPFTVMVKGIGAPPPAAPVAAGAVDLQYTGPAGWTSKEIEGGIVWEKAKHDFYDNFSYRIVILPSQPLTGPLRKTFSDNWTSIIKPTFETKIVPLPLVRRMKSGMAVAFDQDPSAKNKDGVIQHATLYLLARGNRFVPVLGFYFGLGDTKEVDLALNTIFESASIPGAGKELVALLDPADLLGKWSESSYVLANYVTSAGAYAGDASIATASFWAINQDGTFKRTFIGMSGTSRIRETDEGKWKLEDNALVLDMVKDGAPKTKKYRIFGAGSDEKGGSFLVITGYADTDQQADLSIPRRMFSGEWYKKDK